MLTSLEVVKNASVQNGRRDIQRHILLLVFPTTCDTLFGEVVFNRD